MAIVASMPLQSGSLRSISVTSGWCSRNRCNASAPLAASATSSMSGWFLMTAAIPSRKSGWSSTLKMRIIRLSLSSTCVQLPLMPLSNSAGGPDLTLLESNPARHAQLDLGSQCDSAQNAKPGADSFGPLAHSAETPVSIPSPLQFLRIDPAPVVAHRDAQLAAPIFDIRLDILGPGMAVSIDNRLTANAVNFVTQLLPQFPLPSFHNHSKSDRWAQAQVVRNTGKGLAERWKAQRAQALHGESSLLEDALHHQDEIAKSRLRIR